MKIIWFDRKHEMYYIMSLNANGMKKKTFNTFEITNFSREVHCISILTKSEFKI